MSSGTPATHATEVDFLGVNPRIRSGAVLESGTVTQDKTTLRVRPQRNDGRRCPDGTRGVLRGSEPSSRPSGSIEVSLPGK